MKIPDDMVSLCATLSERYISDRFLPDKAIDLMDEACACASLKNIYLTENEMLNKKLKSLVDEEEQLDSETENIDYEKIAKIKSQILKVKERLKELEPLVSDVQVTIDDLARVIELWTGVPAAKIKESEFKKIGSLETALKKRIIGQDEAIALVAAAIKRNRAGITKRRRPASFIFVGPTGVGKTRCV